MPKKKKAGEQGQLIDTVPENFKELVEAGHLYKEYQAERMAALQKEIDQKKLILELMKKAGLQTLEGGKMKFEHDGLKISVTPRDELVKVVEKAEVEDDPDE